MKKITTSILFLFVALIGFSQINETQNAYQVSESSINGTWYITELGMYCDLFTWETWGWDKYEKITNYLPVATKELDNVITFTEEGVNGDGKIYGIYENNAGDDGEYAGFENTEKGWDFNSRYRKIPIGTGTWVLDGDVVTITVGGVDYQLTVETIDDSEDLALSSPVDYKAENFNWDEQDYFYEEIAHMSKKMWYNITKTVSTPEPAAPTNLQIINVSSDSFTLTWDNDPNATDGTNIYIVDENAGSGDVWITTVGVGENSYTYQGTYGSVTIEPNKTYIAKLQALPDNDGNAYSQIEANTTATALTDKIDEERIRIYPSPVMNELTIDADNATIESVTVYNSIGNKVKSVDIPTHGNEYVLPVADLSTGIYIVKIRLVGADSLTKKFIKQ